MRIKLKFLSESWNYYLFVILFYLVFCFLIWEQKKIQSHQKNIWNTKLKKLWTIIKWCTIWVHQYELNGTTLHTRFFLLNNRAVCILYILMCHAKDREIVTQICPWCSLVLALPCKILTTISHASPHLACDTYLTHNWPVYFLINGLLDGAFSLLNNCLGFYFLFSKYFLFKYILK